MQMSSELDEASIRRMEWRCRRGMLELDLLFKPFVKKHLPSLNHAQIAALDELLDLPDNVLWDFLMGKSNMVDADKKELLVLLLG